MKIKNNLRKVAKWILSENGSKVSVEIVQINVGNIHKGKTFLITGGSKGLGFQIASKIVSEGGRVLITGRNKDSLLKATKALGKSSDYIAFDNSNVVDIPNLFVSARKKIGRIDHMICNAGISNHDGDYSKVTEESWDQTFDINLKGSFFMAQEFLKIKHREKEQYGSILFISSETGKQNYDIPYGLTKAALNSLTGALARREVRNGINCTGSKG